MTTYLFEEGTLTLIDPHLSLHYREPFTPVLLPPLSPEELWQGRQVANGYVVQLSRDYGTLYAYGLIHNSHFEGEYVYVYPSGGVRGRHYYLQGLLHGPSRFYSPEGLLLAQSWFLHGKQVGEALWYHREGTISCRQHYKDGLRHGLQEYYYADGTIKTSMNYNSGALDGTTTLYHPDGAIDRTLIYSNDELLSADIAPPHPQPPL